MLSLKNRSHGWLVGLRDGQTEPCLYSQTLTYFHFYEEWASDYLKIQNGKVVSLHKNSHLFYFTFSSPVETYQTLEQWFSACGWQSLWGHLSDILHDRYLHYSL